MRTVPVSAMDIERLEEALPAARYKQFREGIARARDRLAGRTIWHINSTEQGGGVAELLRFVLGYLTGAGIDCRWLVLEGDHEFFEMTKRFHILLHSQAEDPPGDRDRVLYEETMAKNLGGPAEDIRPGDAVMLHDPQTVGLAPGLTERGARALWSCHIGADEANEHTRAAWQFLLPYVQATRAQVFSRRAYTWEGLAPEDVEIIPPCIDACSPKNQSMDDATADAILIAAGIFPGDPRVEPAFRRDDWTRGSVSREAEVIEEQPLDPALPYVVQVSRWDPLKDPLGVLSGFVEHTTAPQLLLAGPSAAAIVDDPDQAVVLKELREAWERLPRDDRARAHLACLPMDDIQENAAIVNAIQRRATVVVQKSIAEGFGLTVAEAMWKSRPVVAGRVGGIQDQIVDGESGLLTDPRDLQAFGRAVMKMIEQPDDAARMGARAHDRAAEEYLAPRYITRTLDLIERAAG